MLFNTIVFVINKDCMKFNAILSQKTTQVNACV